MAVCENYYVVVQRINIVQWWNWWFTPCSSEAKSHAVPQPYNMECPKKGFKFVLFHKSWSWTPRQSAYRCGKTHSCRQTIRSSGNGIWLRNKWACWIWMYRHVSDVIRLKTNLPHTGHHTRANREQGFPQLVQMKESNHAKSHKRDVFPQWDTLKGRTHEGCYSYMCMCVRIDPGHVHGIRLSWEICSKLDFKQNWACFNEVAIRSAGLQP